MGACFSQSWSQSHKGPPDPSAPELLQCISPAHKNTPNAGSKDAINHETVTSPVSSGDGQRDATTSKSSDADPVKQLKMFKDCTENIVYAIDDVLSDLKLLRPLAQGGFGTCFEGMCVYHAWDTPHEGIMHGACACYFYCRAMERQHFMRS